MDEQAILKNCAGAAPGFLSKSTGSDPENSYHFECWMFSQAIDLGDIDHITVDGVDYTLN